MIAIRDVSVVRRRQPVLDGISLDLHKQSVTAVIGPNGSGKSTLLRVLAGSITPESGSVHLDGRPLRSFGQTELARRRAVLSQERPLDFSFTIGELAAMGARTGQHSSAEISGLVDAALGELQLRSMADRRVDLLSGGERQRAHLARVLVQIRSGEPQGILYMDEPLSAQDPAHQLDILDLARRHAEKGGLVVIVLHDLNAAARVADRVIALHRGHIAADGAAQAVITPEILSTVFEVDMPSGLLPPSPYYLPQAARRLLRRPLAERGH